jgi:nucleotide-binding universal stress UspA family protein
LKILIGYDGSSNAKKALEKAAIFGYDAEMIVVHVYSDISEEESGAILSEAKEILDQAEIKSELRSVKSNNPPQILSRIAEDEEIDIIVVGSRGLGRGKTFVLGSVSTKVVQDAPCDVLVVKE